jgi:magnesium transporter
VVSTDLPAGTAQVIESDSPVHIELPEEVKALPEPVRDADGRLVYTFPKKCTVPRAPVDRWRLALLIGLAVSAICVWGTFVGSMLPFIFKRLGYDPGVASSPFVATFVDVTGIMLYFTFAKLVLSDILG